MKGRRRAFVAGALAATVAAVAIGVFLGRGRHLTIFLRCGIGIVMIAREPKIE